MSGAWALLLCGAWNGLLREGGQKMNACILYIQVGGYGTRAKGAVKANVGHGMGGGRMGAVPLLCRSSTYKTQLSRPPLNLARESTGSKVQFTWLLPSGV